MALATRDDLLYGPLPGNTTPSHRSPPGRICDVEGCETILSTYNSSESCWIHARPEYPHASNWRRAPWEARRSIAESSAFPRPPSRSSDD
jgi:hypothetical protein